MARHTFFSFYYERDIWRANVVRNSWVTQGGDGAAGFWDMSLWEESKLKGDAAIEELIDDGLYDTSVTVVLIGAATAGRKWINYEIRESVARGNGLLGVHIHKIADRNNYIDYKGTNPFSRISISDDGKIRPLSSYVETYDYVDDDGYSNLGEWIEEAATMAGR